MDAWAQSWSCWFCDIAARIGGAAWGASERGRMDEADRGSQHQPEARSAGPLAGIRVLDLTSVVMGPYATQVLADMGAEVIKLEPPAGDVLRHVGPMRNPGMGHLFLGANRNKRSVALDLKRPEARAATLRIAARADVLIHNIRPQAMDRLGLGYHAVAAVSPGIVYVAAVGFGSKGRYAGKPAYDDLIQGASGLASVIMETSGEPRYVPLTLADRTVGLYVASAISAALVHRERTGQSQWVEVPMFEVFTQFVLSDHLGGLSFDPPVGEPYYARLMTPHRRPYATADGHLCVLIYNDKQWRGFFRLIGQEERLASDARFSTHSQRAANIDAVYAFVAEAMRERTTAEWIALLERADIPVMPVNTVESLIEDPHLADVGFFQMVDHPSEGRLRIMESPGAFSACDPPARLPAPRLGEHTAEVLREVGLSEEEIASATAAPEAGEEPAP
jgi:crotonobetainyl-CoA:carnitine CoA-transferase CaiB-like acyl-CoA transferase